MREIDKTIMLIYLLIQYGIVVFFVLWGGVDRAIFTLILLLFLRDWRHTVDKINLIIELQKIQEKMEAK